MLAILPSILDVFRVGQLAEVEGGSMDALIKAVLDYARYLRRRDVDAGWKREEIKTNLWLAPSGRG